MIATRIKKGLDIPLAGSPEQRISDGNPVSTVAVLGPDTIGLRPVMEIEQGDRVRIGQPLFRNRGNNAALCSPGTGVVEAINRGRKRSLQSVVIRLEGDDAPVIDAIAAEKLDALPRQAIVDGLLASGDWTSLRTRPFSKIPSPDASPHAIFVTAIDTNPHAPDPAVVIDERPDEFSNGLAIISKLSEGPTYVCTAADANINVPEGSQIQHAAFAGPHPAGLVGTHIHFLCPVSENRTVWHIGYQDVIAIGRLFTTGIPDVERVISLGGTAVTQPRLLRTRFGASIEELVDGELVQQKKRIISGSVLSGRHAIGPILYLGRYHLQISVLPDIAEREFLAWARPGHNRFSSLRAFASHLLHRGDFPMTTSQNGSPRAMVSVGSFERVMPMDILATPLLKALLVGDTETARNLGCLELDEEDLALCSFVCNGKYEYGPFLRENLTDIEVNG